MVRYRDNCKQWAVCVCYSWNSGGIYNLLLFILLRYSGSSFGGNSLQGRLFLMRFKKRASALGLWYFATTKVYFVIHLSYWKLLTAVCGYTGEVSPSAIWLNMWPISPKLPILIYGTPGGFRDKLPWLALDLLERDRYLVHFKAHWWEFVVLWGGFSRLSLN